MSIAVERMKKRIEPLKSCQIKFQYIFVYVHSDHPSLQKRKKKEKKKKLSETPHKIFLVIFLLPLTLSCYFINSLDEKTLSTPPTIPTPTAKLKILFFRILNPRRILNRQKGFAPIRTQRQTLTTIYAERGSSVLLQIASKRAQHVRKLSHIDFLCSFTDTTAT